MMCKQWLLLVSAVTVLMNISVAWAAERCDVPSPFVEVNEKSFHEALQQRLPAQGPLDNAVLLVNFWAAWCAPCRKELPFLQGLQDQKIAQVNLINIEDTPESAQRVLREVLNRAQGTRLNTAYERMEVLDILGVAGLPATFVSAHGKLFRGVGILKDEQGIHNWLVCLARKEP